MVYDVQTEIHVELRDSEVPDHMVDRILKTRTMAELKAKFREEAAQAVRRSISESDLESIEVEVEITHVA